MVSKESSPSGQEKRETAERIYREASINPEGVDSLNYNISVQLESGQYDMDWDSHARLKRVVSENFLPREWRFNSVMYYMGEDADGEACDKIEFETKLDEVGLTIQDISEIYYHRALAAGYKYIRS